MIKSSITEIDISLLVYIHRLNHKIHFYKNQKLFNKRGCVSRIDSVRYMT